MTKFQKQMLTIAAAGALTAVTALPAMAFEHNFNGTFVAKTYLSNIDGNTSGTSALGLENTKSNNFTDQRTRINYTAKASDDLKLVTQFEMQTWWGVEKASYDKADGGGDIDTDGNNLVVKHAYLDFNIGKNLNAKVGQQAYKDKFGGLYVDADLPMAYVAYKQGAYTLGLGYSRFNDEQTNLTATTYRGNLSSDLYAVENTYAINKDTKVGLSYYLNRSDATTYEKRINTLGLFGQTKMGALDLSTFVAMQKGFSHPTAGADVKYHGWAANVLAKMKLGNGLARTGFLFTSGNNSGKTTSNHGWQTLNTTSTTSVVAGNAVQNSYNESGMMLLVRNTSMGGTSNDNYLRKPITNIALLHAGYNANLTEKLYANGNIGMAWLPASDYNYGHTSSGTVNGSDILGAEANVEVGYKLYPNLTLKAQAAYVKLGSAYKLANGNDPADPYTIRAGAYYSF